MIHLAQGIYIVYIRKTSLMLGKIYLPVYRQGMNQSFRNYIPYSSKRSRSFCTGSFEHLKWINKIISQLSYD